MLSVVCGVIFPGGGHFCRGQWGKGLVFALVLGAMTLYGLHLGWQQNFRAEVVVERHPVSYVLQYALGGLAIAAQELAPSDVPPDAFSDPRRFEIAILYTSVAGLLNVLLLLDLAFGRRMPIPEPGARGPAVAAGTPADPASR